MKKILLSVSALTLGVIALASCGGNSSTNTVKGADGEEITLKQTSDATEVSKALYAVGTSASTEVKNISAAVMSYKIGAKLEANVDVKASIGKDVKYSNYEYEEAPTEAQITEANNKFVQNVKLEATADASLKTTASAVTTTKNAADTEEDPFVAMLNNQTASVEAKACKDGDTLYATANAKVSDGLLGLVSNYVPAIQNTTMTSLDQTFGVKAKFDLGEKAVDISNTINKVQNFEIDSLIPTQTTTGSFYDTETFKTLVSYVEKLGVEISSVNNGVVKFELNLTGKKINALTEASNAVAEDTYLKALNSVATTTLENTSIFDDNKTYISAYVSVDVAKALPKGLGVSIKDLAPIATLAQNMMPSSSSIGSILSMVELSGSLSLDLGFNYNDDVKFNLSKNSFSNDVEYLTTTIAFD